MDNSDFGAFPSSRANGCSLADLGLVIIMRRLCPTAPLPLEFAARRRPEAGLSCLERLSRELGECCDGELDRSLAGLRGVEDCERPDDDELGDDERSLAAAVERCTC